MGTMCLVNVTSSSVRALPWAGTDMITTSAVSDTHETDREPAVRARLSHRICIPPIGQGYVHARMTASGRHS